MDYQATKSRVKEKTDFKDAYFATYLTENISERLENYTA